MQYTNSLEPYQVELLELANLAGVVVKPRILRLEFINKSLLKCFWYIIFVLKKQSVFISKCKKLWAVVQSIMVTNALFTFKHLYRCEYCHRILEESAIVESEWCKGLHNCVECTRLGVRFSIRVKMFGNLWQSV